MRKVLLASVASGVAAIAAASPAAADVAFGLRGGTTGVGAELTFGMTDKLNLRVGYALFDYSTEIEDTDVTYDAELQLRNPAAFLDWHPAAGGFRISLGVVGASTKVVGTGVPTAGNSFIINGNTYNASQIGKVDAEIEASSSVAPYLGLGWGNPVDDAGRWTVMFDIGAIYYGSEPEVTATATCGATLPTLLCTRLQADIAAEKADLESEVDTLTLYPVVNFGVAFRF